MTEYDDEALRTKTDEFLEFNQVLREYRWKEIKRHIGGLDVLEVGCGHTYMLEQLGKLQDFNIWGIDPDNVCLMKAREVVPEGRFFWTTLEAFITSTLFNTVICSHVIEHTDDPFEFLKAARRNLYIDSEARSYDARLIVTCPNTLSLHKRVSEIAGLSEPYKPSATDVMQGHKHIFDRLKLEALVRAAGFEIEVSKGIMLKPFPNAMMSDLVTRRFADALYEIGKDPALTDYCSSLLIVARPR